MKVTVHSVDTNNAPSKGKGSNLEGTPEIAYIEAPRNRYRGSITLQLVNNQEYGRARTPSLRKSPTRDITRSCEVMLEPQDVAALLRVLSNATLPTVDRVIALKLASALILQHAEP